MKILRLNVTDKCNKHCPYCYYPGRKNHFNENTIVNISKYKNESFDEVWIIGGEPGMLNQKEINLIFNELEHFDNIDIIKIYTNSLFLKKLKIKSKWNIFYMIHLTCLEDYIFCQSLKIQYSYIVILNDKWDFEIIKNILENNEIFELAFDENIKKDDIDIELFNLWKELLKYENIKKCNENIRISSKIFSLLLNKNIKFLQFKMLISVNILYLEKYWNSLNNEFTILNLIKED